jgi:hypothetical protein
MRRIAYLFLGLCLTVGMVGCAEDTATDDTTTTTDPVTDPATDADADGDMNAADEAPADPAVE